MGFEEPTHAGAGAGEARLSVRLDASGRVDAPVSCVSCGGPLRGVAAEGRCPGCGAAAARSLDPRLLRFASPLWLNRLVIGAVILAAAPVIFPCLWTSTVFVLIAALVMFTASEPGGGDRTMRRLRPVVRYGLVVSAGLIAGGAALRWNGAGAWGWAAIGSGLGAAVATGFGAVLYGRALARRVPAPRLVAHTNAYLTVMLALLVGVSIAAGLGLRPWAPVLGEGQVSGWRALGRGVAALLPLLIWSFVLAVQYLRTLDATAREARRLRAELQSAERLRRLHG